MSSDKNLKAWLNYNCSQGNNWVTIYRFEEILSHTDTKYLTTRSDGKVINVSADQCTLKQGSLRHVYFTYMTETLLISLIEDNHGRLYLIHNELTIIEEEEVDENIELKQLKTIEVTDEMIDQYKDNNENLVKKVDTVLALPQVRSVESKIYLLNNIRDLLYCLSGKELKNLGLRRKKWFACEFKKVEKDELCRISFMDFINVASDQSYVSILKKFIEQSGDVLNLTHNYSVTPQLLAQSGMNAKITQLIMHQNFQIDDFDWLKNFPNIKLLNFWYNHRIEYKHIEQMCEVLPNLEVFNLHACCRVNLRIVLPLLKLNNIQKIAIDDPQFWCQKSIHELFILPNEWRNVYNPSLQKLAINSKNLTLDIVDYLLTACPNLQQVLVDEDILTMIGRNIIAGYEKENLLTFHSWQNPQKGLQISKKVTFKNLFKDTYNSQMFSESMLKKIKEQRELKNEPEQIPITC